MYRPARQSSGRAVPCSRAPRLLSAATVGAVTLGTAFSPVPAASADQGVTIAVDIVVDSYMAGEGFQGTYTNPDDQRHRSSAAPALQALSRGGLRPQNRRVRLSRGSGVRPKVVFTKGRMAPN